MAALMAAKEELFNQHKEHVRQLAEIKRELKPEPVMHSSYDVDRLTGSSTSVPRWVEIYAEVGKAGGAPEVVTSTGIGEAADAAGAVKGGEAGPNSILYLDPARLEVGTRSV